MIALRAILRKVEAGPKSGPMAIFMDSIMRECRWGLGADNSTSSAQRSPKGLDVV